MYIDNNNSDSYSQQDSTGNLKDRLRPVLDCTDLKKESSTSYAGPCPKCGGKDRFVYRTDSEKCWCRKCHERPMDVIGFHCWYYEKKVKELFDENYSQHQPGLKQTPQQDFAQHKKSHIQRVWDDIQKNNANEKAIYALLCDGRKISEKTVKTLLEAGTVRFKNHVQKPSVAVSFTTLQGDTLAIQCLSTDGEPYPFTVNNRPANKVFIKGSSPGKDCFFITGTNIKSTKILIVCESVINAITAFECFPEACCVALGGSTYTKKAKALNPYISFLERVIVCGDNDQAGEKMVQDIRQILGSKVHSVRWLPEDPKGHDINDLLQAGQSNRIIDLIQNAASASPDSGENVSGNIRQQTIAGVEKVDQRIDVVKQKIGTNLINDAIEKSKTDPGAMFEAKILEALQEISVFNPAKYARFRLKFKEANKDNSVARLDKLVKTNGNAGSVNSKADELVDLLKTKSTFFHNQDREAFVSFDQDGHTEVWSLSSKSFEYWTGYAFYTDQGRTAGETTLKTAIGSLSGLAKYEGEKHDTFLRVAVYQNGYVIDLCNDDWSVVFVTPDGWEILKTSPVKFWRTETMRELPVPSKKGELDVLWKHLNISEEDRLLLLAWILEALRPDSPYTIAEFIGGQGTAKSTTQSNIRALIDPNAVNLRAAPKTVEDIFVGAANNYLTSQNNLSHISPPMQDAYCTLATGGGNASRKLYTDFEEALTETKRPVMFNGISSLATAQDLIDRVVRFNLPEILEYKEESILKKEFLEDKPGILGSLLDLFSKTLKKLPDIKIKKPPRMADFARLGEAMSQVLGNNPDTFLDLYNEARHQAVINALDGSPVALAIQDLLDKNSYALDHVLMKDALEKLSDYRPYGEAWPKSPRGLGDALRRNKPGLKAVGINIIFHNRGKKGVPITIERASLLHSKNNIESQHTLRTPHTPITEKLDSQALINGDEGVHGVGGVCQNGTQFFKEKKGMPEIESTPDEVII